MFNTTQETFPVPFLGGDAFDPTFLSIAKPVYDAPATPPPDLASLTTLNQLRGHVSAISICAVFHCFDTEEAQIHLARAIASLLSPQPGSMIIGFQAARPENEAGTVIQETSDGKELRMFYFSPSRWTELWDGGIFEKGTVKVEAKLAPYTFRGNNIDYLVWCVTRL